MGDWLNTHAYDGQLKFTEISGWNQVISLPIEEKQRRGKELIVAAEKLCPLAQHHLSIIVNSIGTGANYDPSNQISADDLISLCFCHRDNSDFLSMLELQLIDMRTGFCPQGRTHRLFQLLLAFPIKDIF